MIFSKWARSENAHPALYKKNQTYQFQGSNCLKSHLFPLSSDKWDGERKIFFQNKCWPLQLACPHPTTLQRLTPQSLRDLPLPCTLPAPRSSEFLLVFSILSSNMQSTCPIFEINGYFSLNYLQFVSTPSFWEKHVLRAALKVWSGPAASKLPENIDMQILGPHPRPTQ